MSLLVLAGVFFGLIVIAAAVTLFVFAISVLIREFF